LYQNYIILSKENIINKNNKVYIKKVKKQISIKLEEDTIIYFKELSAKIGIPYQNLINSYLTDCALNKIEPKLKWQ
jgi:predicted DNA binding CopG/RHH family protein